MGNEKSLALVYVQSKVEWLVKIEIVSHPGQIGQIVP